jgi:U6 snRNA-associated Sm-like protein LSm4
MVRRRRPLPASPRSLRARDRRTRTAPRSAASRAPPLARGRAPRANPRALAVVRGAPGRTPRVRAIRPRVRARPPPGANEIRSIARSRGADPSLAPSRHTRGRGVTLGVHAPASRAIPRLSRSSPSTRNPDPLHPPSPHPRSSPLSLPSTNQIDQLVELKNGETYNGHLVSCDTWMNVHLKEVICTSKDGDRFWRMANCYVRGNTIKYVCVPDEVIGLVQEENLKRQSARPAGGRGRGRGGRDGGRGEFGGRGGGRGGRGRGEGGRGGRGGRY